MGKKNSNIIGDLPYWRTVLLTGARFSRSMPGIIRHSGFGPE